MFSNDEIEFILTARERALDAGIMVDACEPDDYLVAELVHHAELVINVAVGHLRARQLTQVEAVSGRPWAPYTDESRHYDLEAWKSSVERVRALGLPVA